MSLVQFVLTGCLTGLVYAVIALAFVLVYRASGIFNLAQGGLVMMGGYLVWWLTHLLGLGPWMGMAAAVAISFGIGIVIERLVLRPMVGQPVFSLVMITVGVLILLQGVALFLWGAAIRPFPRFLVGPPVPIGPFVFPRSLFIGGLSALVIVTGMWLFFARTLWGMRLTAVAEGHVIAQSMGISPRTAIALSWGAAMALSTWGAVLLMDGRSLTFLVANAGLKVLVIPLVSGLESVPGVILGGIILGVGEALASAYLDPLTQGGMSVLFPFVLMLVALLIRPQGLFGWRIIERV